MVKFLVDQMYSSHYGRQWSHISKLHEGHFPCTEYRSHRSIPTRWSFILMEIFFSLSSLIQSLSITNSLLDEKRKKVKEILKLIHIQPLINYFAWACRALFIQINISLAITSNFHPARSMIDHCSFE